MELGYIFASVLLILFAVLATYDGFYLHIFRYRLYEHEESKFEHLTHTIRSFLFPLILFFLCLTESYLAFLAGLLFVIIDIVVLGIDAYVEKDSRIFMGGLPRWEYIVHLFVNGFHFALISILIIFKFSYQNGQTVFIHQINEGISLAWFQFLVKNILPGAILVFLLHILVSFKTTAVYWNKFRNRITCC